MHRHSGNRMWRITVPPHLRRRRRGYQDACYHATKENGFSPVHSVTGFKKLNPTGFETCRRSRIGGNVVITFGPVSSPPSDARRVVVTLPARKKRDWRLFCCCRAAMESNRNRERRSHHCVTAYHFVIAVWRAKRQYLLIMKITIPELKN